MTQWQQKIADFERIFLDRLGRYTGLGMGEKAENNLRSCGWRFEPGEYIPVTERYSRTLEFHRAYDLMIKLHYS